MARIKFPDPASCNQNQPVVFCDSSRIIKLYNYVNATPATRLSPTVKRWFHDQALAKGWGGCGFAKNVQNAVGAGFILWIHSPVSIGVAINTFVFADGTGVDEEY